jgi:hypothetical protein
VCILEGEADPLNSFFSFIQDGENAHRLALEQGQDIATTKMETQEALRQLTGARPWQNAVELFLT